MPRLRAWSAIWLKKRHLLDIPKNLAHKLGQAFVKANADFEWLTAGIAGPFHAMGAFATEHVPILDRWSRGDFSIMQPWISNPTYQINIALQFMIAETSKTGTSPNALIDEPTAWDVSCNNIDTPHAMQSNNCKESPPDRNMERSLILHNFLLNKSGLDQKMSRPRWRLSVTLYIYFK